MRRLSRPSSLPRLRSVPPADPPYDEERRPGWLPAAPLPTQGALALVLAADQDDGGDLRDGAGARGRRAVRAAGTLPDERALRSLGQAMAEILAGRRPPGGIADRLTDRAYAGLLRAGRMIQASRPPMVGRPHVHRPRDDVIEVCLLVHCGERSRMLAIRLERHGTRWRCTDFETA